MHAYQYLPFASNIGPFDRVVVGDNSVLSALCALYYMRQCGERIAISIPKTPGFWGYEFLEYPQCYTMVARMLSVDAGLGARAIYRKLYESMFLAVENSGSVVISPELSLAEAVVCDDMQIVTITRPIKKGLGDVGDSRLAHIHEYSRLFRASRSFVKHERLYSGVSSLNYLMTAFDYGVMLPSRPDGLGGVELDARFSSVERIGTATFLGGSGDSYIHRVIADLASVYRLYETGVLASSDLYLAASE